MGTAAVVVAVVLGLHIWGPIKTISYAIQASPWQPWRELAVISGLIAAAFVALIA